MSGCSFPVRGPCLLDSDNGGASRDPSVTEPLPDWGGPSACRALRSLRSGGLTPYVASIGGAAAQRRSFDGTTEGHLDMTTPKPSELGRFIRRRRQELGISIREFAVRIKKSPTFVVLLETQATPPSTTDVLLRSLAVALEAQEDELYGLVRKVPKEALPSSGEEVALFRRVQRMSDKDKATLLASLKRKQGEP